jgi:hypothetical protein
MVVLSTFNKQTKNLFLKNWYGMIFINFDGNTKNQVMSFFNATLKSLLKFVLISVKYGK